MFCILNAAIVALKRNRLHERALPMGITKQPTFFASFIYRQSGAETENDVEFVQIV